MIKSRHLIKKNYQIELNITMQVEAVTTVKPKEYKGCQKSDIL